MIVGGFYPELSTEDNPFSWVCITHTSKVSNESNDMSFGNRAFITKSNIS